jgi:hypothetical protein
MRCTWCRLGLGVGLCLCAVGVGEVAEFKRPATPVCDKPPHVRDFGPPENCHHAPGPHPVRILSVTVTTVSSGTSPVLMYGQTALTYVDSCCVLPIVDGRPGSRRSTVTKIQMSGDNAISHR